MTFRLRSLGSLRWVGGCAIIMVLTMTVIPQAQIPSLVVKVGDVTAYPGTQNAVVPVYLDNLVDTITGFNLYLEFDRIDIAIFKVNVDTIPDTTYWDCLAYAGSVCTDSAQTTVYGTWDFFHVYPKEIVTGNIDTTGTLCSGWEFVSALSTSGSGYNLNIAAIANMPGGSNPVGILPGQQGGTLIKVLADVYEIPDTATIRTANILIQTDFKDHFGFSRSDGTSITWVPSEVEDTNCFVCTAWAGDICLNWMQVPSGGTCDSVDILVDTVMVLDTANVKVFDGSLTVLMPVSCGNIDASEDNEINIADLVYLVDYMFASGPAPDPVVRADMDCNGEVNVADLVLLVDFMFASGPPICEGC